MDDLPARLCQTLFPLACSISLIYLAGSDSGTLFFHILRREQKYPARLCLSLWETTAKNAFNKNLLESVELCEEAKKRKP